MANLAYRAVRPATQRAAESAPVAFATLIGPVQPARRPAPARARNLLDTVAHELRNPLASLSLSLDMLVNDIEQLEPEAALRLLRRAQRSTAWLQTLTENLTSTACLAAGRLDIRLGDVDVRDCIEDAVLLVAGLLEQRAQSVELVYAAASTVVRADKARVVQVVANLLSNASRYSVDGDQIEVHVSLVGQHVRVRVIDHGPGISPADQQHIFSAWTRGDDAPPGGLGLGLNIVQHLVQQHGGRAGVESTLGQGASFWFTLPVASVP
jgi:signal transduction histidine kinase